jgi:hypothetical protein
VKPDEGAAERRDGQADAEPNPEFDKFADLARKLMVAPKAEADERRKQWEAERRQKRRRSS